MNYRKLIFSILIIGLSLILVSVLAKRDNRSKGGSFVDENQRASGFICESRISSGNGLPAKVCHTITLDELTDGDLRPCAKCCKFHKFETYYYNKLNRCMCLQNDIKTHNFAIKSQLKTTINIIGNIQQFNKSKDFPNNPAVTTSDLQ